MSRSKIIIAASALFALSACSSAQKERQAERDQISKTSGMYCEFVNGEIFPDVDVQMNIEMAKRCDSSKTFSITAYRTPSENQGVIYCCSLKSSAPVKPVSAVPKKDEAEDGDDGLPPVPPASKPTTPPAVATKPAAAPAPAKPAASKPAEVKKDAPKAEPKKESSDSVEENL